MSTITPFKVPPAKIVDDRAPLTYILCAILLPFATFFVGLRFYFRLQSRRLGLDDWITLLSLVRDISNVWLLYMLLTLHDRDLHISPRWFN
jgi:hypothetical protein